jgi:hypothetical protein
MDKDVFLAILSEHYERMKPYIIGEIRTTLRLGKETGVIEYKIKNKYDYDSVVGTPSSVILPLHSDTTASWHVHPSPSMLYLNVRAPYKKAVIQEERKVMPSSAYFSRKDLTSNYDVGEFSMLSFYNEIPNMYLSKTGWYLRGLPYEYIQKQLFIYKEVDKSIANWWKEESIKTDEAIKQKRFNELAEKYNVLYNTNHTVFFEDLHVKQAVIYNLKAMQYHYEHSLFNYFIYIGEV